MVFLLRFLEIEKKLFSLKRLFSFFDSIWSGRQSALKKYTLEVWQVCLKRADIRTILYSPHYQQKKYSTFHFLSQFIYQESSDQIIFLNFRLQFYKKKPTNMIHPPPPSSAWMIHVRYVSILCAGFKSKKSQRTSWSSKKKILRKMTWIPIQSFVHRDYSKKKNPRLLSTTFSRYFTISNSSKIIPFFSVALFSLYYYPHTTIPAPFLCFWKTPSRLLLPSFSEKLKDWLL